MSKTRPSIEPKEKTGVESQKSVRCKSCGHEITDPAWAIEPHEHTFRNPGGYSFHVLGIAMRLAPPMPGSRPLKPLVCWIHLDVCYLQAVS